MTALKNKKLLDPFFQRRYRYVIKEGSVVLGEVSVLDPEYILTTFQREGIRCLRK